jgi:hypothetical protein
MAPPDAFKYICIQKREWSLFVADSTPEQTSLLKYINEQLRAECMDVLKIEHKSYKISEITRPWIATRHCD